MLARLKGWLAALGAALAVILAAFVKGRAAGKADAQAKRDAAYRDTTERVSDAGKDAWTADGDAVRDRLREHTRK